MGRSHERGHLLVPHLDEFDFAFASLQCAEDPVYAISRETVDPSDTPLMQAVNNEVANGFGHDDYP
jgi:hypothetical protein